MRAVLAAVDGSRQVKFVVVLVEANSFRTHFLAFSGTGGDDEKKEEYHYSLVSLGFMRCCDVKYIWVNRWITIFGHEVLARLVQTFEENCCLNSVSLVSDGTSITNGLYTLSL